MAKKTESWDERMRRERGEAERLAAKAELRRAESQFSWELTAYQVLLDGKEVGVVAKEKTSSYRKAGRLITRTFHPIRWRQRLTLGMWPAPAGMDYPTRGMALRELMIDLIRFREDEKSS